MKIGLIGVGVVGGTLREWLENNTKHELILNDERLGYNGDIKSCTDVFVSVPIPSPSIGKVDYSFLKDALKKTDTFQNVYIRSTILPGVIKELRKEFHFNIFHIPEFLTERRASEDMENLPIIAGVPPEFKTTLERIFPNKEIKIVADNEAEMIKYAHNCHGAIKVTYWNIIKELCDNFNCDFEGVSSHCGMTGFINKEHTQAPGPDGKYGYGGKCFPPNMLALFSLTDNFSSLIGSAIADNNYFRNKPTK